MTNLSQKEILEKIEGIKNFIYFEAKLTDEHRHHEWLQLFTEDTIYWIPTWQNDTETVTDVKTELNIIYLDYQGLKDHVFRITSGNSPVMNPLPRVNRYITNVLLGDYLEGSQQVFCNWLMQDYRREKQQFFGGDCEYHLREVDGKYKIAFKKVRVFNDRVQSGHLLLV